MVGDINAYYVYTESVSDASNVVVIEANGKTPLDARMDAELKVEQNLDLSMLSTLIIGEDIAKHGLLDYLDVYYRDSFTSLSSNMVLVEGSVKDYLVANESWSSEAGEYYTRMIESAEKNAFVKRYTIQTVGAILYADGGTDLALPYIKIQGGQDGQGRPEIAGVALFTKDKFTGRILEPNQSIYLGILEPKQGRESTLSFIYEGKPLTVRVIKVHKEWEVLPPNSMNLRYDIKIEVNEFAEAGFRSTKKLKEVENFVKDEIKSNITEVLEILQEEKSDVLGFGKYIRTKNLEMFKEDNWQDKFAELNFNVDVKVKIQKVGIIH